MAATKRVRWRLAVVTVALLATACSSAPRPGGDQAQVDAGEGGGVALDGSGGIDPATGEPFDAAIDPTTGEPLAADGSGGAGGTGGATAGDGGGPSTGGAGGGSSNGGSGPGGVQGLFGPKDDTRGIDDDSIVLCAHAALTYGAAFNTSQDDLNVYWSAVNDAGGIHGRKVEVYYENDNYSPDTAVQAATACKDKHDPFALLGGIGFDQIPAVRSWAQNNKVLYLHHTATENGAADKTYSFTALPTTETMGEAFAELIHRDFRGKKVGIIKRGSENWEPGIVGFKRLAKKYGIKITIEQEVQVNKGAYLQDIVDLQNAGAEVVFLWLNALESTEFIGQAKAQQYHPQFVVFPFNLTSQTLGSDALNPPIAGVAMFNGYSKGDRSGQFSKYADDLKLFEAQYAKYRPNVDLGGVGGDLLFLNWSAQKASHTLFLACGRDCTRNKFVQVMRSYKGLPTSSGCEIDFTRGAESLNGRRGGFKVSFLKTYRAPDGNVNFRNTDTCVEFRG